MEVTEILSIWLIHKNNRLVYHSLASFRIITCSYVVIIIGRFLDALFCIAYWILFVWFEIGRSTSFGFNVFLQDHAIVRLPILHASFVARVSSFQDFDTLNDLLKPGES